MNLAEAPRWLAYIAVFFGTAVEGEIIFATASVLATTGRLDPVMVFVAATLGGSAGDQFYFYAFRGRLRSWILRRFPSLGRRRSRIQTIVHKYSTGVILACRFLPGLRIAIPVTCAFAGVSAVKFSICSLVGSSAWAATILLTIFKSRETSAHWGISSWWGPVATAILILLIFGWISLRSRKVLEQPTRGETKPE